MYANFTHRQGATNYKVQGPDQIFARGKSIALQCENYDKSCFYAREEYGAMAEETVYK